MAGWAIVIGIDDYRDENLRLHGAVRDAVRFGDWVTRPDGGRIPRANCRFLLGRHADSPALSPDEAKLVKHSVVPSTNNLVKVISEVVATAEARGETDQLYFYYSGHGITAELAGREESALTMPDFSARHPEHSLAVRSLTEHLETTPFQDQFFFLDACREAWGPGTQIGRWPIPRRRDPGAAPVQQFILYATSPGRPAQEVGWPDEAVGAFTEVLIAGLTGTGRAKAWSWDRNRYEVRWERLANYVNRAMRARAGSGAYTLNRPTAGWPIQVPQDGGSRGVADRERDALLAFYHRRTFPDVTLTLEVDADPPFTRADVTISDSIGTPVVQALRVQYGKAVTVALPPRTYSARVETPDKRLGTVKAPIELYCALTTRIELSGSDGPLEDLPGPDGQADGFIEVLSPDSLSMAAITDESGRMVAALNGGQVCRTSPGFYRVRHLRPERALGEDPAVPAATAEDPGAPPAETFVVLASGQHQQVRLGAGEPQPPVVRLAEALGGGSHENYVTPYQGAEPLAWAQPSTILAAAIDATLSGTISLTGLGSGVPSPAVVEGCGIALYAVVGDGNPEVLSELSVRVWPIGTSIPSEGKRRDLKPSELAVAGAVVPLDAPVPHWLALERGKAATVLAVPVQPNRLSVVVAQVDSTRTRLYQFQPKVRVDGARSPRGLRQQEHLQRLLLSGTLEGARPLAEDLAARASEDPFAGLLAGYTLLRLGLHDQLDDVASAVLRAAPSLSDAFILRGEMEAHAGHPEAAGQAFVEAVNAGIPMFGEGLTRLVEGLRASAFHHPRGALVRHIFRCHARGSMWAEFAPSRPLQEGQLVISGADLGYEG